MIESRSSNDIKPTDIRPKEKNNLVYLLYLRKANDVTLNSEQTRQAGLLKSSLAQVLVTKDAAIFELINDRVLIMKFVSLLSIAASADEYDTIR